MREIYFRFRISLDADGYYSSRPYYYARLAHMIRAVVWEHFLNKPLDIIRLNIEYRYINDLDNTPATYMPQKEEIVMENTRDCDCFLITSGKVSLEHALEFTFNEMILLLYDVTCVAVMRAEKFSEQ